MVVYIDVLFLIDFIVDYLILTLSEFSFRKKILKKSIASIFGAAYSCLYALNAPNIIFTFPIRMGVLFLMCVTVSIPCNISTLIKNYMTCILISFFICGSVFAICLLSGHNISYPISDTILVTGIITVVSTFSFLTKRLKKLALKNKCTLEIFYNGKKIKITGMTDTGNSLKDPFTGDPVIVADEAVFKHLFSDSVNKNNLCEFVKSEDFKIIPYKTISDCGTLYGFKPDKVTVNNRQVSDVIIAMAPTKLKEEFLLNPILL